MKIKKDLSKKIGTKYNKTSNKKCYKCKDKENGYDKITRLCNNCTKVEKEIKNIITPLNKQYKIFIKYSWLKK